MRAEEVTMLSEYFDKAIEQAGYKLLENRTYFGEIPDSPGVWSNEATLEKCPKVLRQVSEERVLVGIRQGHHGVIAERW